MKIELKDTDLDIFEHNVLLDFHLVVNKKTGEIKTSSKAYYKGLEFVIYEATEKKPYRVLTIEGSLHKYWNNGAHNFNDFNINAVNEVLKDLKSKFRIDAKKCVLRQLEIGINIIPPIKTKNVLKHCLLHKTTEIKSIYTKDEGTYNQTRNQRYYVKLYDKKKHYTNKGFEIDNEIMRIEKKYSKMLELKEIGIITLQDLVKNDLSRFKSVLVNMWNDVLFYDSNTLDSTKYEFIYSNVNYWTKLKDTNYNLFKHHRKNLNTLIANNPNNLKNKIANLISQKVDYLNTKTTENTPLYIRLISVVPLSEKTDKSKRVCLVTGFNISMQKRGSFLLSHTGIRYYLKTDIKVFTELKRRYLPMRWNDADNETQINELAHNIRNINNNRNIKQNRLYTDSQYQLFDLGITQKVI